jgi:hypothetical protein
VADRAGEVGVGVLLALAPLVRVVPAPAEAAFEPFIPTDAALVAGALAGAPPTAPPAKGAKRHAPARPVAARVVFVSEEQVLRLVASSLRPRGVPVVAKGPRPAGLRLSGVGALGIGMLDGDVLTRAVGQPVLSSGAVIQAVLLARARRAPVLEGEFWRGNERWVLRVAQPYLPEGHATSASPAEAEDARLTVR